MDRGRHAPLGLPVGRAHRDRAAGDEHLHVGRVAAVQARCSGDGQPSSGSHHGPFATKPLPQRAPSSSPLRDMARPMAPATTSSTMAIATGRFTAYFPTSSFSVPMPSISTSSTSPRHERPDALGRAGEDDVARLEGHHAADVGHERGHVEDHVLRLAVLARLAVDAALDAHARGVERGLDQRPDGAEGVEALAARELHVLALDVARRDVARARVPEDVRQRVGRRDVLGAPGDDDGELGLVLDLRALGRAEDRAARFEQRRRRLEEQHGLGRRLGPHLPGVRRVVAPDAHDLRRRDGAEQVPSATAAVSPVGLPPSHGAFFEQVTELALDAGEAWPYGCTEDAGSHGQRNLHQLRPLADDAHHQSASRFRPTATTSSCSGRCCRARSIPSRPHFDSERADTEELNARADAGDLDVVAVSVARWPTIADKYLMLPHGMSVGRGYGPVVVASKPRSLASLEGRRIGVPGLRTTATLVLRLLLPRFQAGRRPHQPLRPRVRGRCAPARSTRRCSSTRAASPTSARASRGSCDIGEGWAEATGGLPLPLGGNAIRRSLGADVVATVSRVCRGSIAWALDAPRRVDGRPAGPRDPRRHRSSTAPCSTATWPCTPTPIPSTPRPTCARPSTSCTRGATPRDCSSAQCRSSSRRNRSLHLSEARHPRPRQTAREGPFRPRMLFAEVEAMMDPALRTSGSRVAQQRLRFEALRRRVFDELEEGSARWRLTWMLPYQLSVVALLILRGESHGRAAVQVLVVGVVATLFVMRIRSNHFLVRKVSFIFGIASYFVLLVTTGGLASPLLIMGAMLLSAAAFTVHDPRWLKGAVFRAFAACVVTLALVWHTGLAQLPFPLADANGIRPEYVALALTSTLFVMVGVYRMGCTMTSGYERAALELAERREELCSAGEDRSRALEGIAARLAHEVKNPLAAIKGLRTHMARHATDPKTAERLAIVAAEADRLQSIVDGFLSFSRGLDDLNVAPTKPRDVVARARACCSRRAPRRRASRSRSRATRSSQLDADAAKLRQALLNLVLNAIQASPRGSTVAHHGGAATARAREITVHDDGVGMTPEVIERIRKPYFTTKEGGTGLGVAVARGLVEQHGGRMDFKSASGKGTTVAIVLPDEGQALHDAAQPAARLAAGHAGEAERRRCRAGAALSRHEPGARHRRRRVVAFHARGRAERRGLGGRDVRRRRGGPRGLRRPRGRRRADRPGDARHGRHAGARAACARATRACPVRDAHGARLGARGGRRHEGGRVRLHAQAVRSRRAGAGGAPRGRLARSAPAERSAAHRGRARPHHRRARAPR